MTITIKEKDIKQIARKDDGLIEFWIKSDKKAQSMARLYDRNGAIISNALQGENKTNYIYDIYYLAYKYCAVKLK